MDLKQMINDFRELQVYRKRIKHQTKTIKMSHVARVELEEGMPSFWAEITFTQARAIIIHETTKTNGLPFRRSVIFQDEVATYHSDHDQLEINVHPEAQKPDVLIIFEDNIQRIAFENAFRHFMEYR